MDEPQEKQRSGWMAKVIMVVVTATISISITELWRYYSNQVSDLEYHVTTSGSLNNMVGSPNILKINDIAVNDAGLINVNVFNTTTNDYDSLTIRMHLKGSKKQPVSIDYADITGGKERIHYRRTDSVFYFTVFPVNRSSEPFLKASFITQDITKISCAVDVQKTGLEPRRTEPATELESAKYRARFWMIVSLVMLSYGLTLSLFDVSKRMKVQRELDEIKKTLFDLSQKTYPPGQGNKIGGDHG